MEVLELLLCSVQGLDRSCAGLVLPQTSKWNGVATTALATIALSKKLSISIKISFDQQRLTKLTNQMYLKLTEIRLTGLAPLTWWVTRCRLYILTQLASNFWAGVSWFWNWWRVCVLPRIPRELPIGRVGLTGCCSSSLSTSRTCSLFFCECTCSLRSQDQWMHWCSVQQITCGRWWRSTTWDRSVTPSSVNGISRTHSDHYCLETGFRPAL
jgi:hypothetical protein